MPNQIHRKRIDIVIIAFAREIDILLLQLRSISKFFDKAALGRIHVIWNDDLPRLFGSDALSTVNQILRLDISSSIEIIERSRLIGEAAISGIHGWRVQQVLKLASARLVQENVFMIMDAKNHFIRPVTYSSFVSESGRPYSHYMNYTKDKAFMDLLSGSLSYFNVGPVDRRMTHALPTTTPYVIVTKILIDMLNSIENNEGCFIAEAFLSKPSLVNVTEFLLYYSYICANYPDTTSLYEMRATNYITFFSKSPQGEMAIRDRLAQLDDPNILVMGIHRHRFLRLTSPELDKFKQIWLAAGLFVDLHSVNNFIANVQAKA